MFSIFVRDIVVYVVVSFFVVFLLFDPSFLIGLFFGVVGRKLNTIFEAPQVSHKKLDTLHTTKSDKNPDFKNRWREKNIFGN